MTAPTSDTPLTDERVLAVALVDPFPLGEQIGFDAVHADFSRRLERTANLLREALLTALRLECPYKDCSGSTVHCVGEGDGNRSQAKAAILQFEALKKP